MITTLPTLSADSYVTDTEHMCDYLLSHIYLTNYSQSELFYGDITSIAKIIHDNNNNLSSTINELSKALNTYFTRYFPIAIVEVVQKASNATSGSGMVELELYINVTDSSGMEYNLARLFNINNGKLLSVTKVINN